MNVVVSGHRSRNNQDFWRIVADRWVVRTRDRGRLGGGDVGACLQGNFADAAEAPLLNDQVLLPRCEDIELERPVDLRRRRRHLAGQIDARVAYSAARFVGRERRRQVNDRSWELEGPVRGVGRPLERTDRRVRGDGPAVPLRNLEAGIDRLFEAGIVCGSAVRFLEGTGGLRRAGEEEGSEGRDGETTAHRTRL